MEKIVVVYIGQDCEKVIEMSLKSVKGADAIVFLDGGSEDKTKEIVKKYVDELLYNKYNKIDKMMNGRQRNIYLNYVKEKYPGWWCLVLDPDEIVEDFSAIRNFINTLPKEQHNKLWCIKMRHLVGDLSHEDATQPIHYVPNRLFKIRKELFYQEVEHPVIVTEEILKNMDKLKDYMANVQPTTIWHLRECMGIFSTLEKYKWNMEKSEMHSKEQLDKWYHAMLFGYYPKSIVHYTELPKILREEFMLE